MLLNQFAGIVLFSLLMPIGHNFSHGNNSFTLRLFHLMLPIAAFFYLKNGVSVRQGPFFVFLILPLLLFFSYMFNLTSFIGLFKVSINVISYVLLANLLWSWRDRLNIEKVINELVVYIAIFSWIAVLLYVGAVVKGPSWAHFSDIIIIDRHQYRLRFLFHDPNFLAYHLISFFWIIFYCVERRISKLALVVPVFLTCILTMSNSFFISVLMSLIIVSKGLLNPFFWRWVFGCSIFIGGGALLSEAFYKAFVVFLTKFTYGSGRLELWATAVQMILSQPFGYGWGRSPEQYRFFNGVSQEAHNTLLDFGISMGWVGMTFYTLVWMSIFYLALRDYRLRFKLYPSLALSIFLMQMTISTYFSSVIIVLLLLNFCWRLGFEKSQKTT